MFRAIHPGDPDALVKHDAPEPPGKIQIRLIGGDLGDDDPKPLPAEFVKNTDSITIHRGPRVHVYTKSPTDGRIFLHHCSYTEERRV